jgi:hypothetical protein
MFPLGVSFHIEHPVEDFTTHVTRDLSKPAIINDTVDGNNAKVEENRTYFFRAGFREPLPRGRGGGVGMSPVSVRIMAHTVWQNSGNVLSFAKTSWILNCQPNSTTESTG